MNDVVMLVILLFLAEVLEAFIFYAPTLEGYFQKHYALYRRHIFLFFLAMPGFYATLFIVLYTGILNGWMVLLLALKIADIFLKIETIKTVFIQKERNTFIEEILHMPFSFWFVLFGAALYASMLYVALVA